MSPCRSSVMLIALALVGVLLSILSEGAPIPTASHASALNQVPHDINTKHDGHVSFELPPAASFVIAQNDMINRFSNSHFKKRQVHGEEVLRLGEVAAELGQGGVGEAATVRSGESQIDASQSSVSTLSVGSSRDAQSAEASPIAALPSILQLKRARRAKIAKGYYHQDVDKSRARGRGKAWKAYQRNRLKDEFGFDELPSEVEEELERLSRTREDQREKTERARAQRQQKVDATSKTTRTLTRTPHHEFDNIDRLMREAQAERQAEPTINADGTKAAQTQHNRKKRKASADVGVEAQAQMLRHAFDQIGGAKSATPWWANRDTLSNTVEPSKSLSLPSHSTAAARSSVEPATPQHGLTTEQQEIMHNIFGDSPPSSPRS